MAYIQVNMMSECLMRTVNVNVLLPSDKIEMPDKSGRCPRGNEGPFKTLYLLHGMFGSEADWVNGTNLQRWADEKNLAVVMPAGENRFYLDQPAVREYFGRYIGEELVELTRRMFPLSRRREDTFIGGLSMGGYGALRNGLKYRENFGYIAALSAADVFKMPEHGSFYGSKEYLKAIIGDLDKAQDTDINLRWLADHYDDREAFRQKIYLACGTEDLLIDCDRELRDMLQNAGIEVTYEESSGGHDWDFWNRSIKRIIDWLPLEEGYAGLSSGNVGTTITKTV